MTEVYQNPNFNNGTKDIWAGQTTDVGRLGEAEESKRVIGRPIIFCGPSGAGKSTLIKYMQRKYKGKLMEVVSHTSRKPRQGEVDGMDYHFVSREEMAMKMESGFFIESATVHENLYGTSWNAVESVVNSNKICLLDIDAQGVKNVKKNAEFLNPLFVLVKPPNEEEQEKRIFLRMGCKGCLDDERKRDMENRLAEARQQSEFYSQGEFDAVIVNDSSEEAQVEVQRIITNWFPSLDVTA